MKKTNVRVGPSRRDEYRRLENRGRLYGGLFALGVLAICLAIVIPMSKSPSPPADDAAAVSAIDTPAVGKEHLSEPGRITSAEPEWSIFEYIGERIAEFLRGE